MEKTPVKVLARNKRAFFEYTIDETLECGIELLGTEVKSIKIGKFSYTDCYAKIKNDELWLIGFHISPYPFGNLFNHDPLRVRKLLVHREEIKRLKRKVDEKGFTLVPVSFYLKKGRVKVELGLCRGKKLHDKRESIKKKDLAREAQREFR
ncbi:MAG: SsrA-binding protein SmpB [Spirochaetales bacterium]|nr:MAG: SsrA-binding protein SmpB [Spirochaetales bacterium]